MSMASTRKLQGEIDRVLKQITEHISEFDGIFEKVHSAATPNLKEKYESDLKKEIKKLQRFRDQLKAWAANSDIKNKKPLLDARKAIENEMERFKALEKETKTKAYSKEGLAASQRQLESGGIEDPKKSEMLDWLDEMYEALSGQLEEFESKMEELKPIAKKKGKTTATTAETEEVQHWIDRHNYHIRQLESVKTKLEDDEVSADAVQEIQDDIEYYVKNNQDPDFQEDETLYDSLNTDLSGAGASEEEEAAEEEEVEEEVSVPSASTNKKPVVSTSTIPTTTSAIMASAAKSAATTKTPAAGAKTSTTVPSATTTTKPATTTSGTRTSATTSSTSTLKPATSSVPTPLPTSTGTSAATTSVTAKKPASTGPTPVTVPPPAAKTESLASILMKSKGATSTTGTVASPLATSQPAPTSSATSTATPTTTSTANTSSVTTSPTTAAFTGKPYAAATATTATTSTSPDSTAKLESSKTDNKKDNKSTDNKDAGVSGVGLKGNEVTSNNIATGVNAGTGAPMVSSPHNIGAQVNGGAGIPTGMVAGLGVGVDGTFNGSILPSPTTSGNQVVAPGLNNASGAMPSSLGGMSPSGLMVGANRDRDRGFIPDDYLYTLSLLEPSYKNLPDMSDSDRPRQYVPRNPYRTPAYFPSVPAPIFDDPTLFEKLSVDTLFFIFYFQQGTPHQYLSARELKKQSWRYHKNFLTWFQRHDDPKVTTDEYEQGTYVYFDYESGWCQRIKADFTFEYRHLEDELAVPLAAAL